ncbi:MAG: CcoQ/FixQ family Cbb3-type cytochrome c oxidase assembly chaperone [Spirochaetia bacterium]|nr:CcoQ/FixQ family Cbb3-type cytochrome c oxidase assembly chaperone [Spirochaetia bacterium]
MNKISQHFHTDWDKLTGFDWTGIVMVLVISALMLTAYLWVWLPSNKNKFEQYRDFVLKDGMKEKKKHG